MRKGIIDAQWDVVLGVVGLMLLGFLFGAALFPDGLCCQEYTNSGAGQPTQYPSDWVYWGDISNRWQAFFGAFAVVFSYLLWRVSRQANRTAAAALEASTEATKQTKRSVDAYIATESGSLELIDATFPDPGMIAPVFKNKRNGYVMLKRISWGGGVLNFDAGLPERIEAFDLVQEFSLTVAPNEQVRPFKGPVAYYTPLPAETDETMHIVQFKVEYQTAGQLVCHRTACMQYKQFVTVTVGLKYGDPQ